MDCSTPGLPVHHQLPEIIQTHVHRVSDAIQPSHPPVIPFSPHLESFPASGSFQMSQFFPSGSQSTGVSASASVLPMNTQEWIPLGWTGWIFLQSKDSQESSPTLQFKSINSSVLSFLYSPALNPYMTTGKTIALTRRTFVGKVMSLIFNMLCRLVINFLARSKCLLISWLQSPSAVILEPPQNKVSHCFPINLPWSDGTRCHDCSFLNVEL